jgi:hypothetical protein
MSPDKTVNGNKWGELAGQKKRSPYSKNSVHVFSCVHPKRAAALSYRKTFSGTSASNSGSPKSSRRQVLSSVLGAYEKIMNTKDFYGISLLVALFDRCVRDFFRPDMVVTAADD